MSETNDLLARRRAELAARRGALSALKQQELERILNKSVADEAAATMIPLRPADEPAPLSFAQERLWFLHQLDPESTAYNVSIPLRVTGPLNLPALSQSISEAVRRHESLRTTFDVVDGKPVQVINSVRNIDLQIVDLTSLPESQRQDIVRRLVVEGSQRHFDLADGPLFQPAVLRVAEEEHVLLVLLHHIIIDEWSKQLLVREVGDLYQSFAGGYASSLAELPIQYADYAYWHRETLRDEALERELDYWRKQLDGSPEMLNLPVDRPRPPVMTYDGDAVPVVVPEALTEKLRELTRAQGTSLFMTLLASFQMLLAHYTGQDDIVVATPVAGRRSLDTESLIGFFVNTLLVRTRLSGNPRLRDGLERVRDVMLEAQTHQDVPFEKLVEQLHPERSLSHGPLFEVMFVFTSKPRTPVEVHDINISLLELVPATEKFGLTFEINEGFHELNCLLSYRTDLFDRATIERIVKHWQRLLEAMVTDPDALLANAPLLDEAEQAQVLAQFNDTAVAETESLALSLFAKQVALTPEAAAVQFADRYLSYHELDARANQLANHLRASGAGVDTRVGIYLEPSLEMVTAVLAVLKAGAAYVPLDPAYPAERLGVMLANARCVALVSNESLAAGLPETDAQVVYLDKDSQEIFSGSRTAPRVQIEPENIVNVIYTSGSTGVPKGVAMTHRALSNLVRWQTREFPRSARTLQFASLSFDVSFQEIFTTWCSGGTLLLVTNEQRHDVNRMLEYLSTEQVERVDLPFVYLQHLAEACEQRGPLSASLRDVVAAGEQLECTPQIRQLCERLDCDLFNQYGPSETHVVTQHQLSGSPREWPTLAPIGKPIANTQIYILGPGLQPTPIGVAGELFIGGTNLSRGYLDRPELTAERFVPNPFGAGRLYRTGDLARYLPDGTIEFLGRIDSQVKIRGFRIELGEIEATLRKHPEVLHAVVVIHQEAPRQKRLVAYVVGREGIAPNINELKSWLKDRLPAYMAPSDWITLDELPRTPSGKINRAALPAPETEESFATATYSAPRTVVEELLAAIWQQVLNLERVSRDDNFFWLGGHSLLATRITSRIRDTFQVELPVRVLFESPNIAELSTRIEQLTQAGTTVEAPPLRRRTENEPLTLSHAQERLWFLDQLTPGSNAYNLPVAMYISAALNEQALAQSLAEVVRRHEVLRTVIKVEGGQPRPVVGSPDSVKLSVVDLTSLNGEQQEYHAARLRNDDALRPFDLAHGPLLRMTLIRLSADRYLLLTDMHHIVSDGWSLEVLLHEMETLYRSFAGGSPSSLPELEIQYTDYAHWQRDWLQGDVLEAQVEYWKRELEGAPTLLDLQPDHPAVVTGTGLAANSPVVFSPDVSRSLRDFSRREGATLFMTLMAGFHALLARYAGQRDILVGTPIAGRNHAEIEPLIGFFVNMVALRTNFDDNPSFKDLLKQVREGALGAYSHQDVPFELLVEELQPERAIGRNPIFQVVFVLQNVDQPIMKLDGVSAPVQVPPSPQTKFDLELYLQDTPSGLQGSFVYSTDLFEPAFIERMVERFQKLMETVVAQPNAQLATLSLLDEVEYQRIVKEWNDTAVSLPEACIHQLFEQQVEQRPEAIAVEFDNEQLTYDQLNERANQLAGRLRCEGVGPEVFVGVMLERSAELIVALLGIAKAGGVYVPLNPSDPEKRIEFILQDAGVKTLVTREFIAETLQEEGSKPDVKADLSPDNLAYLMYTSGSTGTPKAVGITHRNVLRLVKGANYAELSADEVFLQLAPVSFDASTFEIWGALLNGARLIVFPPHLPSLAELSDFVTRTQVTTLWLTGGLFHQLVDSNATSMRSLKQLLAGGEALSPVHVNKALAQLNGCRLINGYGPTESTTFACCYHITPDYPGPSVPIGRPISNTTAYVLNALEPAGVGERGELFIGGAGLGRGYHNRPDLTAERFLPDPYADRPGARLYRTGDAARYLDQGLIRFLGRVDNQIKLSGFRIEPGEIESVLAEHPAVSKALVMAREAAAGDRRLVAYYVANGGPAATSDDLKRYLQDRLPGFMVPTAWMRLDELPLTPNGKVDRAALPDPEVVRTDEISVFQAPRSQTEEVLAGIWQRVLGVEQIGRDDDFFALGGYSLLATRIISRVRESFAIELPVRSLFEYPRLADLAERIEEAIRSGSPLVTPPLERVTTLEQLPLSYAQQRLWFLDQLIPNNTAYNIPVAYRLRGPINVSVLEQSINETVKRHESLRTNFADVDGEPIQVIAPERTHELQLISVENFAPAERESVVQQLALTEGQRPFNLSSDPLFRTILYRLGEDDHVLLVVIHHIIFDGWSMDVLLRDVPKVYTALAQGRPAALPELPIQYADYARWQRQWLQGDVLEQELSYWRNQLADVPTQLNLPTDRPRPAALSMKGNQVVVEIPQSLTERLRELSQAEGSTLFITLLASFQMLLARYSGQDDIPIGTPIAGRRWVETEDVIGFFVNTLVMRTRLHGNPSVREVLRRVREVTLDAHAHQDVPFEKLVEELRPERTLSHGPLFQTMFVFQNDPRSAPADDGLAFSGFELNYGTEKNDLTLQVTEQEHRLVGSLGYSTDLFDQSTIERMTAHWQRILEAIAEDPEQSFREIDLLNVDQRREMLVEWNATAQTFPKDICLQELFERQVELTPNAPAVSFQEQRLSYADLNRRANQLAHYLRKSGVGPDMPVAIYLERSMDAIVALLGVLKAGGAYLPLETKHPQARVHYVLDDAQAAVIITHERTAALLPEHTAQVIRLDSDWPSIAAEPEEAPIRNTTPENLAYVIYTSGSTGDARGVMVQHRSVVNLATTLRDKVYPAENESLRVSVNAPLMFDSSVKQLVQLLYGHELCIIPEEIRIDGDALASYLQRNEVDVLDCTPSQLRLLLPAGLFEHDSDAPSLVLIGGEAIDDETWSQLAAARHTTFFNVYGPTECTVDTTVQRIEASATEVLIGRPLANVQTYVLDTNNQPVPLGVSGELVIGGAGVARGYVARPDLTAEKFVPDPFSGEPGARLYRSGDRVRYQSDGAISFLGRFDYQVKIRGHRIELGEIEAALRKNPQVREAVVVDHDDGDKRLVAYIVAEERTSISLSALQQSLLEQVPDYMMPAGWVLLDEIPLTPNGKVDRAALPQPGRMRSDTGQSFVAPPTLIEEVLAAIWRQVLNLDSIETNDNFFLLGGHSLLATRIIARIRESFQVELPVRALFESPTLAELSARIESAMRSGASMTAPAIKAVAYDDQLPLSYAQQRLWFLNQLRPDSNAYNLPAEMVIERPLNFGAFQQALTEVIRRHEALRTTFTLSGTQPVQRINAPAPLELPLIDLRRLNPDRQRETAERVRQEAALRPFDLEAGPLVRARLVKTNDQQSMFLLNMHHIVSDGWSMGVLMHEVETLYDSFANGLPSPIQELEVQYADYARWQRDWLQDETLKQEVDFWKQQLDGAPTLLDLQTDHPRQFTQKLRGAQHPIVFSEEVSQWLREFHRQEGATLFMTLMAGFHGLLSRYTGQTDILVGTPTAGRSRVELEPMIGFFVNMIPIRTNFSKRPTFRELVTQVRDASLAAYTHQELPFDKLVEELQPRRAPGRNPIFQAILAFQNAPPQTSLAKVTLPAGTPVSADVKFDLEVHLSDTGGGVAGWLVYSPELFEPAFISRMVDHFQRLFEKAMRDPDSELSTLSLLGDEEYQQVVEDWNDTAAPVPHGSIHQIFEREAEERPDKIAIETLEEQITYRDLNERANRLARRLQREGVGPEVFVGVMVERSPELIVSLLGIAKAGGVYVPLNLNDPQKRIEFILEDAGVKTLVTTKQHASRVADKHLALVYVDELAAESAAEIQVSFTSDNLAYLMYTSGSTGIPKGVGITHRNVVGFVKAANYANLGPEETLLHLAPISFDASTFEIWAALLNGARLVIYPPTLPSLSELGELVARTQVTTLFLTTGLFHQFVDTNVTNIGAVKQLLTGGDALSPSLLEKALEQIENVSITNCYGPTESTVMACTYQVERHRETTAVPIGRPLANTRLYILNAMQPAGIGERGELFIGGDGLGRGYHNQPDLTAERFLPDPYAAAPGSRLYQTGDAARYLNDGLIQFLGRVDDQVKISGFRIEPREIEAVLSSHPGLRAAVVITKEQTGDQKFLVAYFVPNAEGGPSSDELRTYLKERLPEYMVPAAYVPLEELPLTPHGKVDRSALPAPQISLARTGREYVAPQNDLQQQLVDLWEELFKIHPIGITDNFFELGGHSLQMIMLVARVEERLGKRVQMAELFDDPTIAHLADVIGHGRENLLQSLIVPLQPEGNQPPIFGPHASGGNVWCYKEILQYLGPEQPFFGIQPREPENGMVVYHTEVEAMATDYVQAIRGFQPVGPYSLAGWSMGGVIAYEMARQLKQQGQEIAMLALIDTGVPEAKESEYNWAVLLWIFALDLGFPREFVDRGTAWVPKPQMVELRNLWSEARKLKLVPAEMTLIEFRKLFDIFKIYANTTRRYNPQTYDGRISLFLPEDDFASIFNEDWDSATRKSTETKVTPVEGWGRLATGGVDVHKIPGNHFSILHEPHVQALGEQLRKCVEETREKSN